MKIELGVCAWLCELAQEDGSSRTQFVEQDPAGLNFNDAGHPSPYRTTPLVSLAFAVAYAEQEVAKAVAIERERLKEQARANHIEVQEAVAQERERCAMEVWYAIDKGLEGWLQEAERRIRERGAIRKQGA